MVEFAPYQKIPPLEKKKMDNRNGTIEKGAFLRSYSCVVVPRYQPHRVDEDFISFMQLLDASSAKPHDNETLLETLGMFTRFLS